MGWNGSEYSAGTAKRTPSTKTGKNIWPMVVTVGVVLVAIVSIITISANRETEKPPVEETKPKGRIADTSPEIVKRESVVETNLVKKAPESTMKSMTPQERQAARMKKFKEKGIDLTVPSNRVVRTGTEQIMAWIFTTEVGSLPPPLPKIPDSEKANFAKILFSDNPIKEGDSDITAEAKETIQLAKKELIEYIEKGGTPEEFFDYYRGQLVQAYETRKTVQQSVMKVLREEPELALDYLDEVNSNLEKQGIKKIKLHPKQLKHFGISQE